MRTVKAGNLLRIENKIAADHERIYRAHLTRILNLCRLLLRDTDEAEDVAQEVFLRAFERLTSQEPPAVWEAWLVRVAVNACRDRQRSGWWKSRTRRGDLDELAPWLSSSSEESARAREWQARVWQQLRTLKSKQRNVFVLRSIEGWSTNEVAETLGLSAAGVKTHLFRAVRHLRKAVER
ncbi:MAG: RNA polymerase sigma factor [Candidatus Binataceae bacterium]